MTAAAVTPVITKQEAQRSLKAAIQFALSQDNSFWPIGSSARCVFFAGHTEVLWVEFIPQSKFTDAFVRFGCKSGSIYQGVLSSRGNKVNRFFQEPVRWR